jgi:hypothetical protein
MTLNSKIIELNDEINSFIENEKQLNSSQFLKFITNLIKYDNLNRQIHDEEEKKEVYYDFLWKNQAHPFP